MNTLKTLALYLFYVALAIIGLIGLVPVIYAQSLPVCRAVSTNIVTDGAGLARAGNYQCPTSLLTIVPGTYHNAFLLVVANYPLDNATLQFSRRLPIVKDTGGAALDPVQSMDLRPGFFYLVTWRGDDHQIHPTFWRTPLQVARWACVDPGTNKSVSCADVELIQLTYMSRNEQHLYFAVPVPSDFDRSRNSWTLYE